MNNEEEVKRQFEQLANDTLGRVFKEGFETATAPIQATLDELGYGHRNVCEVLRELEAGRQAAAQRIGELLLSQAAALAAALENQEEHIAWLNRELKDASLLLAAIAHSAGGEVIIPRSALVEASGRIEIDRDAPGELRIRALE